jgi:lipoyl-dependent peroxiredoxin
MDIIRHATAVWNGSLKEGNGAITTQSGQLSDMPYTFVTRFETGTGTNPEELLGAAHAGCYSMALGANFTRKEKKVHYIKTTAHVVLGLVDGGRRITSIKLVTHGKIEDVDADTFKLVAEEVKKACIISQALSAIPMEVEAHLD